MDNEQSKGQAPTGLCEPLATYTTGQTLINNLPYIAMILLGSSILLFALGVSGWAWFAGVAYLLYGAAGALWIMIFVCPYCHFWKTAACPCGYGTIAAHLRQKKDGDRFSEKFRKHIPVIVPLWIIPALVGGVVVARSFSWFLLGLLVVFAVDAFLILPVLSRKHGCSECPQKNDCPWMGSVSSAA